MRETFQGKVVLYVDFFLKTGSRKKGLWKAPCYLRQDLLKFLSGWCVLSLSYVSGKEKQQKSSFCQTWVKQHWKCSDLRYSQNTELKMALLSEFKNSKSIDPRFLKWGWHGSDFLFLISKNQIPGSSDFRIVLIFVWFQAHLCSVLTTIPFLPCW